MRSYWLIIWVLLVLLQFLTLLLNPSFRHPTVTRQTMVDTEVLKTLKESGDRWESLGALNVAVPPIRQIAGTEDFLLQRQSLLLQIRFTEQRLTDLGAEVQIAASLQSWLERMIPESDHDPGFKYLQEVQGWLSHFEAENLSCNLKRVQLLPLPDSLFPQLAFELAGQPYSMGLMLRAIEDHSQTWILQEVDLGKFDTQDTWWILGSFRFAEVRAS